MAATSQDEHDTLDSFADLLAKEEDAKQPQEGEEGQGEDAAQPQKDDEGQGEREEEEDDEEAAPHVPKVILAAGPAKPADAVLTLALEFPACCERAEVRLGLHVGGDSCDDAVRTTQDLLQDAALQLGAHVLETGSGCAGDIEALRKRAQEAIADWEKKFQFSTEAAMKTERAKETMNSMRATYYKELMLLREQVYKKACAEKNNKEYIPDDFELFNPEDFVYDGSELSQIIQLKVDELKARWNEQCAELTERFKERIDDLSFKLKTARLHLDRKDDLLQVLLKRQGYENEEIAERMVAQDRHREQIDRQLSRRSSRRPSRRERGPTPPGTALRAEQPSGWLRRLIPVVRRGELALRTARATVGRTGTSDPHSSARLRGLSTDNLSVGQRCSRGATSLFRRGTTAIRLLSPPTRNPMRKTGTGDSRSKTPGTPRRDGSIRSVAFPDALERQATLVATVDAAVQSELSGETVEWSVRQCLVTTADMGVQSCIVENMDLQVVEMEDTPRVQAAKPAPHEPVRKPSVMAQAWDERTGIDSGDESCSSAEKGRYDWAPPKGPAQVLNSSVAGILQRHGVPVEPMQAQRQTVANAGRRAGTAANNQGKVRRRGRPSALSHDFEVGAGSASLGTQSSPLSILPGSPISDERTTQSRRAQHAVGAERRLVKRGSGRFSPASA